MSENVDNKNVQPDDKDKKQQVNVKVSVDNEQTKILMEQLKREETARLAAEAKNTELLNAVKVAEDKAKISGDEAEDAKGKLQIVAEKELEKKRNLITENAKRLLGDDERVKEIVEKLKDPVNVQAIEYTLKVLDDTLRKGEEQRKVQMEIEQKKKVETAAVEAAAIKTGLPPPAGTAPLNQAQMGASKGAGFDSYEAMVMDLRKKEASADPQVAAEAKVILNEFFRKWSSAVKGEYEQMRGFDATRDKLQPSLKEITKSARAKALEEQQSREGNKA